MTEVGVGINLERTASPRTERVLRAQSFLTALSLQAVGPLSCKATVTEMPSSAEGVWEEDLCLPGSGKWDRGTVA